MKKKHIITLLLSTVIATALLLPTNVFANTFVFKFKEFLLNENSAAENYLDFKSTREITVNAPKKYIEQVEVLHKKGSSLAETDVSITNVDILTNGEEVSFINVFVNGNRRTINRPFETDGIKKKFEIGYATLNDNFDLRIEVISENNEMLEVMNFKVPEGSSDIFRINQKFTYKTAGKRYSLYDLLAGRNVFTDLLVEHKLEDIDAEFKLD
ncbi:hypothetical protein [Anaerobacillus alkaliphilus]|nr:hypothetical protein [Anaerobacillus alkaliphilus]